MNTAAEELRKIMLALEETVSSLESSVAETEQVNEAWKYTDALTHMVNIMKTCDMLAKQQDLGELRAGYNTVKGEIQTLIQWLEQSPETQVLRQTK
jgi:hypothetical protein